MEHQLTGVVERVTFHNPDSGFAVLRVQIPGRRIPITVIGNLPSVNAGERIEATGEWVVDRQHGEQFKASALRCLPPTTREGIERYLASGLVKGIGAHYARKIVERFGERTLEVIDESPTYLAEIKGLGPRRIQRIRESWNEQKAVRGLMVFLQSHGIGTGRAVRIYRTYGDRAIELVRENPYRLATDIWGIGFKIADELAVRLGVPADSPYRARAALRFVLQQQQQEGHVGLPEEALLATTQEMTEIPLETLKLAVEAERQSGEIVREPGGEHPWLYLKPLFLAEAHAARLVCRLTQGPHPLGNVHLEPILAGFEQRAGIELAPAQREAIREAARQKTLVITGGPGTGKCVRGDTLVLTSTGHRPIQELWGDAPPMADTYREESIGVVARTGPAEASHVYSGGMQNTIRIQTHLGLEIEGTPNHRIWAMTETGPDWVRLDELFAGRFVAIRRGDDLWGTDEMSPDFAYTLGVISGDGSQSSPNILQISNNDRALLERCRGALREELGCHVGLSESPTRSSMNLRVTERSARHRLIDLGLHVCHSEGKRVPWCILRASRKAVVQYLAGLIDTDGNIHSRKTSNQVTFEITLKSRELVATVQLLLLNLGIVGRLVPRIIRYRYGTTDELRTYWRLTVTGGGVDRLLAVIPTQKSTTIPERHRNPNLDLVPIPGSLIRHVFTANGPHSRREWWAWKREMTGERVPTRERLLEMVSANEPNGESWQAQSILAACQPCYYWDRVEEVTQSTAQVFDLCVPGDESFVANGFVNHNTTIMRGILDVFAARRQRIALAAPTGRAARRLAETSGREAKTIHRLLEFDPGLGGFRRDAANPLECDLLVIDEASMIDISLMYHLLRAVPAGACLILVGDVNQLPSVGPGTVLADIITSGVVPVVRLTEIFRQAQSSWIVRAAHSILGGEPPESAPPGGSGDFYFVEADDAETILDRVTTVVRERIPRRFGLDPLSDIQVLSPMNRGTLGVEALNQHLQAVLNPPRPGTGQVERFGTIFRLGDKVIQTHNNYQKEVFNGDIGRITALDENERELVVTFDGRDVPYDFAELDELMPAYGLSIHRSQGSEYPAVVMPLATQHFLMLQRNLLYTGVTRGKKIVVVVGQRRALEMAVQRQNLTQRYCALGRRMKEELERQASEPGAQ